jgi:hypothetical protein
MRPRTALTAAVPALALAALVTGCSASVPTAPAPGAAPAPSVLTTTSPPTSAPTAAAATSWVMPDLVGGTLQDAQDAVQDLTDYGIAVTTSTDATGAGRMQVLDANWTVCSQSVPPGATITADTAIDFAVVQLDEPC